MILIIWFTCIYIYIYIYVCVRVYKLILLIRFISIHIYHYNYGLFMYIYIYMCVCVRVRVCKYINSNHIYIYIYCKCKSLHFNRYSFLDRTLPSAPVVSGWKVREELLAWTPAVFFKLTGMRDGRFSLWVTSKVKRGKHMNSLD